MRFTKFALMFSAALLAVHASVAQAQFSFTRIVGTGDPVPGATPGTLFTGLDSESANYENGTFAFEGSFTDGSPTTGVFAYDGTQVNKIVFQTDIAPGGAAFGSLDGELVDGGMVSFEGVGSDGFYIAPIDGMGPITTIVDTSTTIPGEAVTFGGNPGEHGRSGNRTLFEWGENNVIGPIEGMYLDDNGTLSVVANQDTPSPHGGGAFLTSFREPCIRGSKLSFTVTDANSLGAIFADFGTGLSDIALEGDTMPNGGTFNDFDETSIDGDLLAVQARYGGGGGPMGRVSLQRLVRDLDDGRR